MADAQRRDLSKIIDASEIISTSRGQLADTYVVLQINICDATVVGKPILAALNDADQWQSWLANLRSNISLPETVKEDAR